MCVSMSYFVRGLCGVRAAAFGCAGRCAGDAGVFDCVEGVAGPVSQPLKRIVTVHLAFRAAPSGSSVTDNVLQLNVPVIPLNLSILPVRSLSLNTLSFHTMRNCSRGFLCVSGTSVTLGTCCVASPKCGK